MKDTINFKLHFNNLISNVNLNEFVPGEKKAQLWEGFPTRTLQKDV